MAKNVLTAILALLLVLASQTYAQIDKSVFEVKLGDMYWPLSDGKPGGGNYFEVCDSCERYEFDPINTEDVQHHFFSSYHEITEVLGMSAAAWFKYGLTKGRAEFEKRSSASRSQNVVRVWMQVIRKYRGTELRGVPLSDQGMQFLKRNLGANTPHLFTMFAGDEYVHRITKGSIIALEYTVAIRDESKIANLRESLEGRWSSGGGNLDHKRMTEELGTEVTVTYKLFQAGTDSVEVNSFFNQVDHHDSLLNYSYAARMLQAAKRYMSEDKATTIGFETARLLEHPYVLNLAYDSGCTIIPSSLESEYKGYLRHLDKLVIASRRIGVLNAELERSPAKFTSKGAVAIDSIGDQLDEDFRMFWRNLLENKRSEYKPGFVNKRMSAVVNLRDVDLSDFMKDSLFEIGFRVACRTGEVSIEQGNRWREGGQFYLAVDLNYPLLARSISIVLDGNRIFDRVPANRMTRLIFPTYTHQWRDYATKEGARQEVNNAIQARNAVELEVVVEDIFGKERSMVVLSDLKNRGPECSGSDLRVDLKKHLYQTN